MKQEELIKTLAKELMAMDTLHQEYQDNDTQIVIDSLKEGNTLNIKVTVNENKDKKEFEKWVDSMDDDIFNEVWESLTQNQNPVVLDEMYRSPNYREVIKQFKAKTNEIVKNKIKSLQKLIG